MDLHPHIKRDIPEFIVQYVAFSASLVDAYKRKTCLILTKNLKLFEFYQKQLVASIDLTKTSLGIAKEKLKSYDGPKFVAYGENNTNSGSDLSIGKYVFHTLNVTKLYIIVQCWDKCVVLLRSSNMGFVIKSEYKDFRSFKITHGQIKYCPLVELEFKSGNILRTDFEEDCNTAISEITDFANKKNELKILLDRVRSAKTEKVLHESITAASFERLQNRLTYGLPLHRSLRLEEKQMLARCGDSWKRVTPHGDIVIGVPLVNQCAPPNLTILNNIHPHIELKSSEEISVNIKYRLFQLKQTFYDLDSVETFLQSEDEELQANVWCSEAKCQILPESFVILLMKFKLCDIIFLKETPLLIQYELLKSCQTSTAKLQIFLQVLDFHEIIFTQRSKYEISFQSETLHQDFLTIAMSSLETQLQITFKEQNDLDIFECCLQQKFQFERLPSVVDSKQHIVFYNHLRNSMWFGCLCLRCHEIEGNDDDYSITSWKFYCSNGEKTSLLVKTILSDLSALQCNIVSIRTLDKSLKDVQHVGQFESALREELISLKKLLGADNNEDKFNKWSKELTQLGKAQMMTDVIFQQIKQSDKQIKT